MSEDRIENPINELLYILSCENERVSEEKSRLISDKKNFEETISKERQKLFKEKLNFEKNLKMLKKLTSNDIIELNIGGVEKITTTIQTLTSVPSALSAMFSGRHELIKHEGKIFIDRDPVAFKLIVEYLSINQ